VLRKAIGELEYRLMDWNNRISKYISMAIERNSRFSDFGFTDRVDRQALSQQLHSCQSTK
jgi:hypothetical protein